MTELLWFWLGWFSCIAFWLVMFAIKGLTLHLKSRRKGRR